MTPERAALLSASVSQENRCYQWGQDDFAFLLCELNDAIIADGERIEALEAALRNVSSSLERPTRKNRRMLAKLKNVTLTGVTLPCVSPHLGRPT